PSTDDMAARVTGAKLQSPPTDDDSLPKPLTEILRKCLARDPAARYGEVQEVRKAVDTLLFSGDFTPTTFNLAFFMHSLFREDIERDARLLKEEREASYAEYLADDAKAAAARGAAPGAPTMSSKTEPIDPRLVAQARAELAAAAAKTESPAAPE